MKQFVKIQSSKTIMVTAGLQADDVTNPDAHIPDRLKVNPLWPNLTVLIKEGVDWYPSEIVEWATVKALVDDKIITIGEDSDEASDEVTKIKDDLEQKIETVKTRRRRKTDLEEIAEE